MLALFRSLERDTGPVLDTLDLVALATVADVVPLTGENRTMVREGLKLINSRQRPFFRALMEETGMTDITAQRGLGFSFAPMVNSVSRLDRDTDEVVRMMISRDLDWIRPRVASLVELNNERKALSEREGLLKGIQDVGQTCILVRDDTLREGIIGILAGKLREEFNRPAVVFTRNDQGLLKGSARSVDAFPLKQSLDRIPPGILLGYGGHTLAAGLSLLPENFDAFSRSFTALTDAALAGSDFLEWQEIDLVIQEEECTRDLLFSLHILEPFGAGCPAPVFGLRALPVSVTYMGKEQQHVKYLTASGLQVIQWGQGDAARNRSGFPRKFVGFPSLNVWRNTASVQFICQ